MNPTQRPIDEYTLAAFIAGTLPENERAEVAAYLAENADARELLQMAYEALEAARHGEHYIEPVREFEPVAASTYRDRGPERHTRTRTVRMPHVIRYAAAAALVFAVGFGMRQAFRPSTSITPVADELRDAAPDTNLDVSITEALTELRFTWDPVETASQYRVVVWDLERAEVVGRYMIADTRFDAARPEMAELKPKLEAGHLYAIRVDAIDKQNRMVRSSESIEFTPSH